MFENKLIALDFYSTETFEYFDEKVFRNFISWLENQKIRMYTVEDRVGLDNVDNDEWPKAFEKYLNDLQLRGLTIETEREIQIEKLLSYAIRLEYSDNVDTYNNKAVPMDTTTNDQNNVLEKIDYTSDGFKSGLFRLQSLLKVQSKHNDTTSVLQALCELIKDRLSPAALQAFSKLNNSKEVANSVQLALKDIELGFDTNDKSLNEAAKILRLLHLKELRKLQTDINETIVVIQAITANPKTDTSLGRVGR